MNRNQKRVRLHDLEELVPLDEAELRLANGGEPAGGWCNKTTGDGDTSCIVFDGSCRFDDCG